MAVGASCECSGTLHSFYSDVCSVVPVKQQKSTRMSSWGLFYALGSRRTTHAFPNVSLHCVHEEGATVVMLLMFNHFSLPGVSYKDTGSHKGCTDSLDLLFPHFLVYECVSVIRFFCVTSLCVCQSFLLCR